MSFSDATEEFMIMKGEGVEGTPFKNDDYDVILKSGDKYIIKDLYYTDGMNIKFYIILYVV